MSYELPPLSPHMKRKRAVKRKRDLEMFQMYKTGDYTLKQIGAQFGVTQTTVHHAIAAVRRRRRRHRKRHEISSTRHPPALE